MTLQQFIDKYNGEGVDYDENGEYWCCDLARAYADEVLQKDQWPLVVGAAGIWDLDLSDDYVKVPNTPEAVPAPGDIIIWNRRVGGGYGHVGIVHSANVNWFTSFDQNWPTGSLAHLVDHSYSSIYGWLHPKENMSDCLVPNTPEWREKWKEIIFKSTQHDETVKYIWDENKKPEDTESKEIQQYIAGLKSQITTLQNKLAVCEAEVKNREDQVKRLNDEIARKESQIKELNTAYNSITQEINKLRLSCESDQKVLQESIDECKRGQGELLKEMALLEAENERLKKEVGTPLAWHEHLVLAIRKLLNIL